jgi:GT2 family glycosyltransferase
VPAPTADEVRAGMRGYLERCSWAEPVVTASSVGTVSVPRCADPRLSVVIVTYRTSEIVLRALDALVRTVGADVPYEVVVVDNHHPGALPAATRLRLRTSGVRLIEAGGNLGFGPANDIGIAHARGELLCLMNPDAEPQAGWLAPLVSAAGDPTVGIAAPVLLDADGSVQEAGATIDANGDTAPIRSEPAQAIADVDYASAACWVLRGDVYERAGGFDADFVPAYFEDADLAMRVKALGLRRVVCAASRVVHHLGESTPGRRRPAIAQQAVFLRKWGDVLS